MRLFRVDFKDKIRPPILIRGKTKAQVSLDMKEKYGEYIVRVDYISHEDAESQFGHFDLFKEGINIKKADMGDVVDDFYKSDAPQFKGKSKAKRRQMAIAAKLSADEDKKVPSMAGLENKPKMKIQLKKATNAYDKNKDVLAKHGFKRPSMNENDKYDNEYDEEIKMIKDQFKNHLDEISKSTAASYISKASRDVYHKGQRQGAADAIGHAGGSHPDQDYDTGPERKAAKRVGGIDKATKILMRNKPKSTGNSGFDSGRKMSQKKMGTSEGLSVKEKFANPAQQAAAMAAIKASGKYKKPKNEEFAEFITPESDLNEEMYFKVNITGLPDMYMTASSAGMIKAKLRKMLKNMDMIGDIVKTPKADVRKAFRMKAMEGEESTNEEAIVEKEKQRLDPKCWDGYKKQGTKMKGGIRVNNCVPEGKAYGPTGISYAVPTGHKDEVDPKTKEKYPERQKPDYKGPKSKFEATVKEKLVGDQHKLDHNKDKKIDKQDMKMVRKIGAVKEDIIDNASRFGPPQEAEVQESKKKVEDSYEINLTSMLTGENPFYRALPERNIQFHTGHSANDAKSHDAHRDTVEKIHKAAGDSVTKRRSGYPDKSGKSMQGMITAKKKDNVQAVVDVIKKHIPKSAHGSIKISEDHGTYSDNTYSGGKDISHHVDNAHDHHQKTKHAGVKFHTAMGDDMPHAVTVSKGSPALKDKKFMSHVKKLVKVNNEGHDEIQDKNADGLDDNQKPEGNKTAKQFPAPKDAKKKMKNMKMEFFKQDEVSDFMIEKSRIKRGDMKMRGGKLEPKAMAALKTMSQDEAKVLVQGLPANLRRSTMKELGIKEVVDGRTKAFRTTVERLITAKNKPEIDEADMTDAQVNTAKKDDSAMVKAAQKKARADVVTAMNKPKMADEAMTPPKMPSKADNRRADRDFAKLSPAAQTHANNSMRQGASGTDAVSRAKKHFGEVSKDMLKRYVKAADMDKSRKYAQADMGMRSKHSAHVNQIMRNRGIDMAKSKMKPAKVAASEANIDELSMKSDKKQPNLILPVKGSKGVSKFERKKGIKAAK